MYMYDIMITVQTCNRTWFTQSTAPGKPAKEMVLESAGPVPMLETIEPGP